MLTGAERWRTFQHRSTLQHLSAPISTSQHPIIALIRRTGPITVADFVDLALYHPEHGYYARAPRRSGRDGDFYTSVDTGPLFGEMIAVQLDEMWQILRQHGADRMDLVEAGAGDGRLTRDILHAAAKHHRHLYDHLRVTLVERSEAARRRHDELVRASHPVTHVVSSDSLPARISGAILANELLDALPVHVVVGARDAVREIYVGERDGVLVEIDGPLSPAVAAHVRCEPIALPDGARTEVGVRALEWMASAADALDRGFVLLFDYGATAAELYSNARAAGTLTTYRRHTMGLQSWLSDPGSSDITAHVNFTAVTRAAERAGLVPLGATDQTYFLMSLGIAEHVPDGEEAAAIAARLSAKTLLLPGGLGSTMKVLAFAKRVGRPALRGFSSARLT